MSAHRVDLDGAHQIDERKRARELAAGLLDRRVDPLRGRVIGLRIIRGHLAELRAVLLHEGLVLRGVDCGAVHECRDVADDLIAHMGQDELVIAGAAADDRLLVAGPAQLLGELQRHRADHQREDGVGVALDLRDIGPEILGADRRPELLDDLAAAILEGLLEAAERLVAERVVGGDGDDFLVALIAGPLAERMGGLRRHEGGTHHVGELFLFALPEVVGGRDRADVEHLVFRGDGRQRIASRGQHAADQHVHLVLQDELVGLGDRGVRLALRVLDDELNVHAAELVAVLLEIHLEAMLHVHTELREDAGLRRHEADLQFFGLRRRIKRCAEHKNAAKKQRRKSSQKLVHECILPIGRCAIPFASGVSACSATVCYHHRRCRRKAAIS